MLYSKERLEELFKESRYRHGKFDKKEKFVENDNDNSNTYKRNLDLIKKIIARRNKKKDE